MLFTSDDHFTLASTLEHMAVPMFAAERRSKDAPFRLVCVNKAHSDRTGMTTGAVRNRRIEDLLRPGDAKDVMSRYARCADQNKTISYNETLVLNGMTMDWNTTLQPVVLSDGTERVVGTAIALDRPANLRSAEEAAYFSAHAQMQVGKLRHFLDMLEDRKDVPADMRGMAMMVNNLTYSIDVVLGDIRDLANDHPQLDAATQPQLRKVVG